MVLAQTSYLVAVHIMRNRLSLEFCWTYFDVLGSCAAMGASWIVFPLQDAHTLSRVVNDRYALWSQARSEEENSAP